MSRFRIHGDNVVECERALGYVAAALGSEGPDVRPLSHSITCPGWIVESRFGPFEFTFLPGYGAGRWNQDIADYVRGTGGRLREAADAVVTRVGADGEQPLFALEFCAALPAGNQAWQRQGRAYSFAHAGIPYFYIAELGGFELGSNRAQKAERLPNPAAPFSFLAMSRLSRTVCLPVYQANWGARPATMDHYRATFGRDEFLEFVRAILTGDDPQPAVRGLEDKCLALVGVLAAGRKRADGLSANDWTALGRAVGRGIATTQYLNSIDPIEWKKTARIKALTVSAKQLMSIASRFGQGLTSASLPLCYIPADKRGLFSKAVAHLYGDIPSQSQRWLARPERDLAIAWVTGFKPRGDDARPDRGLPPFARMLIGEQTDLLTVVYGPAPTSHWQQLANDPADLVRRNGLWESVLAVSDAILCDSGSLPAAAPRLLTQGHWAASLLRRDMVLNVRPEVLKLGEQDVDTALHTIFVGLGPEIAMEGMCNPPGGDWSGISFAWNVGDEHRWLTLPRVSKSEAKRPDHVFAIFGIDEKAMCLCVESKRNASALGAGIGPRLTAYVEDLFAGAPSVRRSSSADWESHTGEWLPPIGRFASVGAFLAPASGDAFAGVSRNAGLDLALALRFAPGGRTATVLIKTNSAVGKQVAGHVAPRFRDHSLVDEVVLSS